MFRSRYRLDRENLLYRRVKLTFKQSLVRFSVGLIISLVLATAYGVGFKAVIGSPKEKLLETQLAQVKQNYTLLEEKFNILDGELMEIAVSENNVYRPVLKMDTLAASFRKSGFGGSNKYEELEGYENSDLMKSAMLRLDELERKAYIQSMSFEDIIPVLNDWKSSIDHVPLIQPVRVGIPLGEGIRFRNDHPVLHVSRWHYGQDFRAPSGTKVYATGAGKVTKAAWTPYGFGNRIEIDHGFGYKSIYAHLSGFNVKAGQMVQRGDLLGFSGSTGISSGPHMHYEVHLNGKVQNPNEYFGNNLTVREYKDMIVTLQSDTIR